MNEVQPDPHQLALMQRAAEMGIQTEKLYASWRTDAVAYSYANRRLIILHGRVYPGLSYLADMIAGDKVLTKELLAEAGLPVPRHVVFRLEADGDHSLPEEARSFIGQMDGAPFVCKPVYGTDGDAVAMNLQDAVDAEMHLEHHVEQYATWMLEEQVAGDDLRIQVIGGRLAAACVRRPAMVTGDGQLTLEELVERHNEEIQLLNPSNALVIDGESRKLMRQQDVYLSTVIPEGTTIQLKSVANMGQGGSAHDVAELHPGYDALVSRTAETLGLETFAIDLICSDPLQPAETGAKILEVNAQAQWLHHTFSEGRTHDIPGMLLRHYFPERG